MEGQKILIIDSQRSKISIELKRIIESKVCSTVDIKGWNQVSRDTYEFVLPVFLTKTDNWASAFRTIKSSFHGSFILPVIDEKEFKEMIS